MGFMIGPLVGITQEIKPESAWCGGAMPDELDKPDVRCLTGLFAVVRGGSVRCGRATAGRCHRAVARRR